MRSICQHGLAREDRICREYDGGEVQDVNHWLLTVPVLPGRKRERLH